MNSTPESSCELDGLAWYHDSQPFKLPTSGFRNHCSDESLRLVERATYSYECDESK